MVSHFECAISKCALYFRTAANVKVKPTHLHHNAMFQTLKIDFEASIRPNVFPLPLFKLTLNYRYLRQQNQHHISQNLDATTC